MGAGSAGVDDGEKRPPAWFAGLAIEGLRVVPATQIAGARDAIMPHVVTMCRNKAAQ